MDHLTADRLESLLAGELPPSELRALAEHLSGGCPDCERVLDQGLTVDILLRLIEAEAASPVAPSADEQQEMWRAIQAPPPTKVLQSRRWFGALIAAALVLVFAMPILSPTEPTSPEPGEEGWTGEKGVAAAPAVALRVLAGVGGRFETPVNAGMRLSREQVLIFSLDVAEPAARMLFAIDAAGQVTQLSPPPGGAAVVEPGGARRVAVGSDWVALGLDDQAGAVTLVAVAATDAHDPAAVIAAWQRGSPLEGVGHAALEIVVDP